MIVKYNDLYEPKNSIDENTLYKNIPFFEDYYITIHLKKLFVFAEPQYIPIVIKDVSLQDNFYMNDLENHVYKVEGSFEKILSPIFKVEIYLFELKSNDEITDSSKETIASFSGEPEKRSRASFGSEFITEDTVPVLPTVAKEPKKEKRWCLYIVKKHIWKVFTYQCIVNIFCNDVHVLNQYVETYFSPHLKKKSIGF